MKKNLIFIIRYSLFVICHSLFVICNLSFVICHFSFLSAAPIHPGAGSTAANFLKIGVGARAVSMAGTFSALADDVTALYWNPAGIIQLSGRELGAMHNEGFQELRYGFVGYVHPLKSKLVNKKNITVEDFMSENMKIPWSTNVLGISAMTLYMPSDLERRSGESEKIFGEVNPYDPLTIYSGTFGAYDLATMVTYAQRINEKWSAGVSIKLINQVIDVDRAYGVGIDLGVLYQHDLSESAPDPKSWMRYVPFPSKGQCSIVLQNFGPGIKFIDRVYNLPTNLKLGLSETFIQDKLNIGLDINIPNDDFVNFAVGGEYYLPLQWLKSDKITKGKNGVFLRAGYKQRWYGNPLGGVSGLALGFGVVFNNLQVDYAFVPYMSLGNTHQISLIFRFLEKKPKPKPVAVTTPSQMVKKDEKPVMMKLSNIYTKINLRPLRVSTHQTEYSVSTEIKNADLSNIEFRLRTRLLDTIKIEVEQIDEIPAELKTQIADKEVFKRFVTKFSMPESMLSGFQFSYRVSKSWVKNKDIDSKTVSLNGVIDGKLTGLDTENVGEDENYCYYLSKSDRFVTDMIVIGTKNVVAPVVPTVPITPVPIEVIQSTTTVPIEPLLTPGTTSQ